LPPEGAEPVPPVPEGVLVPLGFVVDGVVEGLILGVLFGVVGADRVDGLLIHGFALLIPFCATVEFELVFELGVELLDPALGIAVLGAGVAVEAGGIAVVGHGVEVDGVVDGVVIAPGVEFGVV